MPKITQSCGCEKEKEEKPSCSCGSVRTEQKEDCSCGGNTKEITYFSKFRTKGAIDTPSGEVIVADTKLHVADIAANLLARFGLNRMNYAIKPGLYAVGKPDKNSPVLISANYKMSFDALRKELSGIDVWILVLDTKGVNVWCAAGKGTFGTQEIINRIKTVKLYKVVSHKNIIVPQLGAPGVEAHVVRKRTGFKVNYGPVEARDIKAFLASGMKADEKQRTVTFGLLKRLEVTGIEFMTAVQIFLVLSAAAILAASFTKTGFSIAAGIVNAAYFIIAMFVAALSATVIPAALLPVLPGRMFSVKGAITGLVFSGIFVFLVPALTPPAKASIVLLSTAMSSFVFMNYTGTTTFTSLTGVRKEIAVSAPVMIIAAIVGLALQIADFVMKGAIKWN